MIRVSHDTFKLAQVFTIARGSRTEAHVLSVTLEREGVTGRGECVPYARYGESLDSVTAQIESLPQGISRAELQEALPAGAARNAVDCALWDWEAKKKGVPVWELAGLDKPVSQTTAYTLSLDEPEKMRAAAAEHAHRPLLKIKLGTPEDMPRLRAVREGAPESKIIVDANEGWEIETFLDIQAELKKLGVALVEQPLPAAGDEALSDIQRLVPICADESCHTRDGLLNLRGKYDVINIKLDKTGGLTEALRLRDLARAEGFGVMVGCMVGSSLAMAPAMLVAQGADYVDLDGPLLLAEDRDVPLRYKGSVVEPPEPELWG
ncbi:MULTISPECIES: N-acetyl-D-Glu racemase DgcA [unclassified Thioclava]|uniref:N-acetyl-D-Glu racemase DgcA n=1 Tax=unclassified Thioclava TaxID=2621713 RepID=UPI000997CCFF|nr:N-acetyl-D-Glu racemase DgcA [Thioclava sp. F36-6]OOY31726.1 dipeptide epimerase [Thioclava sp. F36-6]